MKNFWILSFFFLTNFYQSYQNDDIKLALFDYHDVKNDYNFSSSFAVEVFDTSIFETVDKLNNFRIIIFLIFLI